MISSEAGSTSSGPLARGCSMSESLVLFFVILYPGQLSLRLSSFCKCELTFPLAIPFTALTTVLRCSLSGTCAISFFASSWAKRSLVLWLL